MKFVLGVIRYLTALGFPNFGRGCHDFVAFFRYNRLRHATQTP